MWLIHTDEYRTFENAIMKFQSIFVLKLERIFLGRR